MTPRGAARAQALRAAIGALLAACALASPAAQDGPEADRERMVNFFNERFPGVPLEDYVHGAGPQEATISGMGHGARVVTAAALIMTSVFAGFVLIDDPTIKAVGFALALGVAVDAFIVRMTIVPAVISLFGRSAWWLPRWLDRLLPNVDIEGEKLREQLHEQSAEKVLVNA